MKFYKTKRGEKIMPKIKRKKHDIDHGKEEDIEVKSGRFRLYFQNRYSLVSLMTDLLT